MNVPDNYDQFLAHESKQEKLRELLPQCEECGIAIDEDYYFEINDTIKCERCLIRDHRKKTEDFIS